MSDVIETRATSVFMDDGGVLHVIANGTPSSAETVEQTVAAIRLLAGRPVPALFDARKWPKVSSDAWMAIIDVLPSIVSATAVLVEHEGRELLGGFPAAVNRLMLPLELFTDEVEAMRFLAQYVRSPEDLEEE